MSGRIKDFMNFKLVRYIFFGGLTTIINYFAYSYLFSVTDISAFSNIISWVIAVIFAFLTNKPFVFKSNDWSLKVIAPEFGKFIGCRLLSGALETGILFVAVDLLSYNGYIGKILTSVLVVVLNYIFSNFFIFRKK